MKARRQFPPPYKAVAAVFCVVLGFLFARICPGDPPSDAATLGAKPIGWADDSRTTFLTGDALRWNAAKVGSELISRNEPSLIAANNNSVAPVSFGEISSVSKSAEAEPESAIFDDDVELPALAGAKTVERNLVVAQNDDAWLNDENSEKRAAWNDDIQLSDPFSQLQFADAKAPNWNDSGTVFQRGADVAAMNFGSPSLVDPALTRWSELGAGRRYFYETKTEAKVVDLNEDAPKAALQPKDGGAIYPTRRGVGRFVAPETFDSPTRTLY